MAKGDFKSVVVKYGQPYSPTTGKKEMLLSIAISRSVINSNIGAFKAAEIDIEITPTQVDTQHTPNAFIIRMSDESGNGFYFADKLPRVEPMKVVLTDTWQVALYRAGGTGAAYLTLVEL